MLMSAALAVLVCCPVAAVEYPAVMPGHRIAFPADEGSHPAFRTEWWYLTGWLEDDEGRPLGFQVTFFRTRPAVAEDNPSQFAPRQLLFAHAAISDARQGRLLRGEKIARMGFGLAGASEGSLDVHIDDWRLRNAGGFYEASIVAPRFRLDLQLRASRSPVLHGEDGFSRKSPDPGFASYYYSLPQLATSGRVAIDGKEYRVHGEAWFDHEWWSALLDEQTHGWDWAGLNMDDGSALMAMRMRDGNGAERWSLATWAPAHGASEAAVKIYEGAGVVWAPRREWRSPATGTRYPVEWELNIGGLTLVLRPTMDDQENDTRGSTGTLYWEGAVRVFDPSGRQIGRGYLELTGYGGRLRL
jgi:predicted secreted hydrolase